MRKTISSGKLAWIGHASNLMLIGLLGLTTAMAPALHSQTDTRERKLIYRVEPEYPPDLKRIHVGGYVRLDTTISSSGTVEEATITGGNPILAEAAVKAVRQWKYEPMASRTKIKLILHFNP